MKVSNLHLLKATGIVSLMTMISRLTGFIRDMVIAIIFGASASSDAFFAAFKIANFMRRLFAEGAFTQAFVPILADYQRQSPHEIKEFIDRISGVLLISLLGLTIIAVIGSQSVIALFTPGFWHDSDLLRFELASQLLKITFPYLLFISLSAFCAAILNTYGRFAVPAFTPVWLNICMIAASLYLTDYFVNPVYALAWGVFVAGIVQLIFQLPSLYRIKLIPIPKPIFNDSGVRAVLLGMLPALFGVSIAQLNLMVDTAFASFLTSGSIAWLYYSDRLTNFPLGVFGVALSTTILPQLAKANALKSSAVYSESIDWGIKGVLLIGIPAMIGLVMMAEPIIKTLFNYGQFTEHDVLMTKHSLVYFALGVPAFMLTKVLASAFFAQHNLKTPVKIGVFAMIVNMILNCLLIGPLAHGGLALATSLSGYLNSLLLWGLLGKTFMYQWNPGWMKFTSILVITNLGVCGWLFAVNYWQAETNMSQIVQLSVGILGALVVYTGLLLLCGLRLKHIKGPNISILS